MRPRNEKHAIIVGAGLAGAAAAFHLAQTGRWRVTVIEKEKTAGVHASGRNAAMIRQAVLPGVIADFAVRSTRALQAASDAPNSGLTGAFQKTGSILWGAPETLEKLRSAPGAPPDAVLLSRDALESRFPDWPLPPGEVGLYTPSDGTVDVARLLQYYLRADPRVAVHFEEEVLSGRPGEGAYGTVQTNRATYTADAVLCAAGAWADMVAARLGGRPLGLLPLRRHLFWSGTLDWVRPDRPYTWDVTRGLYYRPESGGLLLCACDEDLSPPVDATTDPTVVDLIAEKFSVFSPPMNDIPIAKSWAGLRTFATDHAFVIGEDPIVHGLFWVAALGGHGVTTADAVGRAIADQVDRDAAPPAAFAPGRI